MGEGLVLKFNLMSYLNFSTYPSPERKTQMSSAQERRTNCQNYA
jgi:hypothetical protein